MTTYFDNFLKTNQAYADLHGTAHLPIKPKTKVAIVTCMDSRLHVAQALGLALGDAHILRNAGGRVTDDVLRSLVISQQQLGTREIVVLHHTDCGAQILSDGFFYFRKLDLKVTVRLIMPYAGIQTEETSFAILKLYYKSGGNLK